MLAEQVGADGVILAPIELEQLAVDSRSVRSLRGERLHPTASGPMKPRLARLDATGSCQNGRDRGNVPCTDTAREAPVTGTSAQSRSSLSKAGVDGRHG